MSVDNGTGYPFTSTETGTSATWPVQVLTPATSRVRDLKRRKLDNNAKNEWSKFRMEFARELLADIPQGVINYKMERSFSTAKKVPVVKVYIEYIPTSKEGVRD